MGRALPAALAAFCAICLLGVFSFADDSSLSSPLDGRDDGSDDHSSASTSTDIDGKEGRIKTVNDEIQDLDSTVILLEHGTIIMANELEDDQEVASRSSSGQSLGYSIEVSSSIGSELLVPSEYSEKSFSVDSSGNLIGIRSSTFNCYLGQYTVRFPAYGQPQYRLTSSSSYTWTDIDLEFIETENVEIVGRHMNWWSDQFRALIAVATLCFLLILALRRRD